MTTHEAAINFSNVCSNDARLMELINRYEEGEELNEAEFNIMMNRMDKIFRSPFIEKMMIDSLEDTSW